MDWSKAKTVLIMVFLIADIFLGYQYFYFNRFDPNILDSDRIQKEISVFSKQDVIIKGSIPKRVLDLSPIKVKYKLTTKDDVAKAFSLTDYSYIENEKGLKMENKYILVQINQDKVFFYINKNLKLNSTALNEEKCEALVQDYLSTLGILPSDAELVEKSIENEFIRYRYTQKYKGSFIDQSYIDIKCTNEGIYESTMKWFDDITQKSSETELQSPILAIKSLIKEKKHPNEILFINDIKQGYYVNLSDVPDFDVKSVREITAIPTWRIDTNAGVFYVNAYNGKIEN